MRERLKGLNGLSIGLIIASMVLFPYGLLSGNMAVAIIGWGIFTTGIIIGKVADSQKRKRTAAS